MLTEKIIRDAKPKEKRYTLTDINGLRLLVMEEPYNSKLWRFRYKVDGNEHQISLGKWPYVTLNEARERAIECQRQRQHGIDPAEAKHAEKNRKVWTFADIANEWLETQYIRTVTPKRYKSERSRLERLVYPIIGERDIITITEPEILTMLREIEREKVYTAHIVCTLCARIFRYAIGDGRCKQNPTADLARLLTPIPRSVHRAALTDVDEIRELLRAMRHVNGHPWIKTALWFSAYTFARPGEIRKAEWAEFKSDNTWQIPAEKMKSRKIHIVPLATQVVHLLEDLRPLTGKDGERYLFPAVRSKGQRPMSDMTINAALLRLGFESSVMTAHGFRGMASTILNSHMIDDRLVESQLAHVDQNSTRASYNFAKYLPMRQIMMQWWADWLDAIADGRPEPPVPIEIRIR